MKIKDGYILVGGNRVVKIMGPVLNIGFRWNYLVTHRCGLDKADVMTGIPILRHTLEKCLRGYVKPEKKEVAKIKLMLDW